MTEVAPAPNLGSEIEEHSFIERPSVFQAFLMKGRMFCCGAATLGAIAGAVAWPARIPTPATATGIEQAERRACKASGERRNLGSKNA